MDNYKVKDFNSLRKIFNKDTSVCFTCKCIEYKDIKGKFESIEVLGLSDDIPKPKNEDGVRYIVMDLEEISMMKESGIKVIIPSDSREINLKDKDYKFIVDEFNNLTGQDSTDRLVVDEFPSAYGEDIYIDLGESSGNDDYVSAFSSVESEKIGKCCNEGVSYEKPAYVNITFHRSTLELVKEFIGSMDREKSVEHLEEKQRLVVAHGVQDFYEVICDALDKNVVVKDEYPGLANEEEKLLKENMDN